MREEGRERERERERESERVRVRVRVRVREREQRTALTSSTFHPGIWRIYWLSFLDADVLASSLEEDQPTDE